MAEVLISVFIYSELCNYPTISRSIDYSIFSSQQGYRYFFSTLKGFIDLENLNKITEQLGKINLLRRLSFDNNNNITIYYLISYYYLKIAKELLRPDFIYKVSIYYIPAGKFII